MKPTTERDVLNAITEAYETAARDIRDYLQSIDANEDTTISVIWLDDCLDFDVLFDEFVERPEGQCVYYVASDFRTFYNADPVDVLPADAIVAMLEDDFGTIENKTQELAKDFI